MAVENRCVSPENKRRHTKSHGQLQIIKFGNMKCDNDATKNRSHNDGDVYIYRQLQRDQCVCDICNTAVTTVWNAYLLIVRSMQMKQDQLTTPNGLIIERVTRRFSIVCVLHFLR